MPAAWVNNRAAIRQSVDNLTTSRMAEKKDWICAAVEERIHVGNGVDATGRISAVRRFTDCVGRLIADLAAFHELFLNQELSV